MLRLAYGDLTLKVPVDNTDEVGLREVINDEEVEEVFAVLRKKEARMPTNWSRRFKNHVEKLKSGDVYQVAEVVRNLSLREQGQGPVGRREAHAGQGPPDPRVRADLRHRRRRGRGRGQARRGARLSDRRVRGRRPPTSARCMSTWSIVLAAADRAAASTAAVPKQYEQLGPGGSSTGRWPRARAVVRRRRRWWCGADQVDDARAAAPTWWWPAARDRSDSVRRRAGRRARRLRHRRGARRRPTAGLARRCSSR